MAIIGAIESGALKGHVVWQAPYINNGSENFVDKNVRDLDVISIPYPQYDEKYFEENVMIHADEANIFQFVIGNILKTEFENSLNDYKRFYGAEDFNNWDSFQILRYGDGHHFGNHIDDSLMYHRRISMSYYLNNDFDGGEIEFPRLNIKYKPKGNDLVVFPSDYVYNHKVHPVINGTRYTVVNWIH